MAKLTLDGLVTLVNDASAVSTLNQNNTAIVNAVENTLSRDGSTPNTMLADFDINSYKLLNVGAPTAAADGVNKAYVDARSLDPAGVSQVATDAAAAAASAAAAATSETNAATSETNAAASAVAADVARIANAGTFDIGATYSINDAVRWDDGYSRSLQNSNLGNQPTSTSDAFWQVVALDGLDGSNGTGAVDSVSGGTGITVSGTGTDPIVNLDAPVIVSNGGTGSSTAAGARTNLGLGTAAIVNTGTTNGTIPVLTANGLPAVSGQDVTDVLHPALTGSVSVGYPSSSHNYGTQASGTLTIDLTKQRISRVINGGAFTLAPDATNDGEQVLYVTNNGSAGTITLSGLTLAPTSGAFDTVDTNVFRCFIEQTPAGNYLWIEAMQ